MSHQRYINNLYDEFHKIYTINKSDNILIIGSSLSAIDCVLALESNGHTGNISCISRSGILPTIRQFHQLIDLPIIANFIATEKSKVSLRKMLHILNRQIIAINPTLSWRDIFRQINRMEIETLEQEISSTDNTIQKILLSTNPFIEQLWSMLEDKSKLIFINKYFTLYMSIRNPMPLVSAKRLLKLLKANSLSLIVNEIKRIEVTNNKFIISFKKHHTLKVSWIINATGQTRDIANNLFYKALIANGLISKNIAGGILVDKNSQQCINRDDTIQNNLFAIGAKTFGTYLNVNSAEMLSKKAEIIAKHLSQKISL